MVAAASLQAKRGKLPSGVRSTAHQHSTTTKPSTLICKQVLRSKPCGEGRREERERERWERRRKESSEKQGMNKGVAVNGVGRETEGLE